MTRLKSTKRPRKSWRTQWCSKTTMWRSESHINHFYTVFIIKFSYLLLNLYRVVKLTSNKCISTGSVTASGRSRCLWISKRWQPSLGQWRSHTGLVQLWHRCIKFSCSGSMCKWIKVVPCTGLYQWVSFSDKKTVIKNRIKQMMDVTRVRRLQHSLQLHLKDKY